MTLQHPTRTDSGSFALIESDFTVTGIHANPLRTFAFLDIDQADHFGLRGSANIVHTAPSTGSDRGDVQRSLFELEGVTSSQAVAQISEAFDSALDQLVGFLIITAVAVLALALLIAFNATRISVDERRREHATMRAFGVPVRSIMGVVVKEGVLVGALATLIGLAAGFLFLQVMLRSLATTTLPDLAIDSYISPTTIIIAVIVGIVAVSDCAPVPHTAHQQHGHPRHLARHGMRHPRWYRLLTCGGVGVRPRRYRGVARSRTSQSSRGCGGRIFGRGR